LAKEDSDTRVMTPPVAASSATVEIKPTLPADGLGQAGSFLSSYHVGDIAGLIGLLLTWLTYRQARAAKAAAQAAATAAIRSRDQLEMAARLSELSARLRTIRDVYRTDNWEYLEVTKDHAVAIAVEVKATDGGNEKLVELMTKIESALREEGPALEHIKDQEKRHAVRRKLIQRTNKLADSVDALRLTKVKNGS